MILLTIGPAHTLLQDEVYALPIRACLYTVQTTAGTVFVSQDQITWIEITLDVNDNFQTSAVFIKVEDDDAIIIAKGYTILNQTVNNLGVEQISTITGAQNNLVLLDGDNIIFYSYGAAPVISGIDDGYAGRRVSFICKGTSLKVLDEDILSADENQIVSPSINGLIIGENGRIDCEYNSDDNKWYAQTVSCGTPIEVPFNAANFTAATGDWTVTIGEQVTFNYTQFNKILNIWISIEATHNSAQTSYLTIAMPDGFVPTKEIEPIGMAASSIGESPMEVIIFSADPTFYLILINAVRIDWPINSGPWVFLSGIQIEID